MATQILSGWSLDIKKDRIFALGAELSADPAKVRITITEKEENDTTLLVLTIKSAGKGDNTFLLNPKIPPSTGARFSRKRK